MKWAEEFTPNELYKELKDELLDGVLNIDSEIQLAFEKENIVDWYYSDSEMRELCSVDEIDEVEDMREKKALWEQYIHEKDLKSISVGLLLYEIEKSRMLYDNIRAAREALGWSRQELSNFTFIPVRTIQGWEQGQRTPPLYVERWILKELNRLIKKSS